MPSQSLDPKQMVNQEQISLPPLWRRIFLASPVVGAVIGALTYLAAQQFVLLTTVVETNKSVPSSRNPTLVNSLLIEMFEDSDITLDLAKRYYLNNAENQPDAKTTESSKELLVNSEIMNFAANMRASAEKHVNFVASDADKNNWFGLTFGAGGNYQLIVRSPNTSQALSLLKFMSNELPAAIDSFNFKRRKSTISSLSKRKETLAELLLDSSSSMGTLNNGNLKHKVNALSEVLNLAKINAKTAKSHKLSMSDLPVILASSIPNLDQLDANALNSAPTKIVGQSLDILSDNSIDQSLRESIQVKLNSTLQALATLGASKEFNNTITDSLQQNIRTEFDAIFKESQPSNFLLPEINRVENLERILYSQSTQLIGIDLYPRVVIGLAFGLLIALLVVTFFYFSNSVYRMKPIRK